MDMASTATIQAMAELTKAIESVDVARGSITTAALITETLYRKALGNDGQIPRQGDLAPKQWYKVAGLTEGDYDKAKGYLSDARGVIAAAVANGMDASKATTFTKAQQFGIDAVAKVAELHNVEGAPTLTKAAAAIRNANKKEGAPKAKKEGAKKVEGANGETVTLIEAAKQLGQLTAISTTPLTDVVIALFQGAGMNDKKAALQSLAVAWQMMP
jgi:hypothetical protein